MTEKMSLHNEEYGAITKFTQVHPKIEINKFNYIWNIKNFCNMFKIITGLSYSTNEVLNFEIEKKDSLFYFSIYRKDTSDIFQKARCCMFLESIRGKELYAEKILSFEDEYIRICDIPAKEIYHNESKYLINGELTIYFEIDVIEKILHASINSRTLLSYKKSTKNAENLINDKSKSQLVTIVVEGKHIAVNKDLLCSKSTVFKTMFNSGLKEAIDNKVEINDITYNILKYLLMFIKTDSLASIPHVDAEIILELLIAADKYDIQALKFRCEHYLMKEIKIGNIVKYLDVAHVYNAEKLKDYIKSFIKLCLGDIIHSEEYEILIKKYNELLIQITDSEYSIINTDELTLPITDLISDKHLKALKRLFALHNLK